VAKKLTAWGGSLAVLALVVAAVTPLHGARRRSPPRLVSAARAEGPLSAGAAAVPLEVAPGTTLAGFPRLQWASLGVRDAPMARAVVLAEPGFTSALVSADILLVPPALRRAVEARLADLHLQALVLTATHTHSGPGGYWQDTLGELFGTGPYDAGALESLAGRVEEAVRRAAAARVPARLQAARATLAGLSYNRDGGEVDGRLLVVRATRGDGAVVAEVVVFPAHATIVDRKSRLISADWPGALARQLPGVTVVLQGAVGDQTWRLEPGAEEAPEGYARLLAEAVRGLRFGEGDERPPLGEATAEVALPAPSFAAVPRLFDRLLSNLLWSFMPERATVTALRLGPSLLLAVPGEPVAEVGRRWRDALGEGSEVVSLAGDYLGYVETPERVRARSGEAKRTYLGPDLAYVLGDGLVAAGEALR